MVARSIERYSVYLADLDRVRGAEIAKKRPVVVVSRQEMNLHLDTVVACPLTTKVHPRWRSRIQCICAGRKAEIAVDQIHTLSKERLGKRIDGLTDSVISRLKATIIEMYG